jgi:hypothetical protein
MSMIKGRAMALIVAVALLTVAFAGLFFVEGAENPTTLSVTVTAGPIYAGDEVVFNLTGWGYEWDVENDFTVDLYLNDVVTGTSMYNMDHDYFEWAWTAMAGDYDWKVMVTNDTDSMEWNTTGMFHVFAYPAFVGTSAVTMHEDMPYVWNLSAEFSGEGLTFAEDMAPENLAFTKDGAMWTVTPAAEWSGTEMVKIFATDVNDMEVNNTFTFNVGMVNDVPMIHGIDYMDMTYMVVEKTIETEWNETTGEAINWTTVMVIDLPIMEDEMDVNFMVNATDMETSMENLTYEFEENMYFTLELMNESMPYWFHFMGMEDMYGMWASNLTVSDGVNDAMETVWFNVSAVNDAPTIMFDLIEMGDQLERETMAPVNVSVTVADVDSEDLTIMWYIDGTIVAGWDMEYFLYNWSAAGLYNVSVMVSDGELESEEIYFLVNVVEPLPTWTADDIAIDYTEATGDVVVADAEGILPVTYKNLRLAVDYQGIDVTAIVTALDGDELVITITFAGAPYTEPTLDDMLTLNYKDPDYRLYFVKSTFTEAKFNQASPNMDLEPAEADVYSMGFLWDYVDSSLRTISGNDMIYRITLSDLDDAGITKDDFHIFFVASLMDNKISGLTATTKMGYDSVGFHAATHLEPVVDDDDVADDDDSDSSSTWIIIVIIVIVILVAIVLIIVFMMKGKKGEEIEEAPSEEMPPQEEGEEMPMEEGEMPMEEQPVMEGYEQPPEEPIPEEPVPEEPVPEEPVPEEPVPETPPAPEPPVPPVPEPPAAPMPPQ